MLLYAVMILHSESNNVKTIIKKYKMKCQEHLEIIPESRTPKIFICINERVDSGDIQENKVRYHF